MTKGQLIYQYVINTGMCYEFKGGIFYYYFMVPRKGTTIFAGSLRLNM